MEKKKDKNSTVCTIQNGCSLGIPIEARELGWILSGRDSRMSWEVGFKWGR